MAQNTNKPEISKTRRFKQIVSVLNKYKVYKGLTPVKLRMILEDLGPTYVKLGQIMSSRSDILPLKYTTELQKLRSNVQPMAFETVREVLEESYGKKLEELFVSIDPVPIGSASMAQVHQAVTRDGQDVVIKVQRPHIYEQMEVDVEMLRKAAKMIKLDKELSSIVDPDTMIDEFWQSARQELDFEHEASNAIRFGENYTGWEFIKVPKVYKDISTKNVLVMEDIHGTDIDEYEALAEQGYSRSEIAQKLAYNYIDQVVEKGFFHADPHSGNLRIQDGKIVWMDFGMMGSLSERDTLLMREALQAVAGNDITKLTDAILSIGEPTREVDYSGFSSTLENFMNRYLSMSLDNIDIAKMAEEMIRICHDYGIKLPASITMLARSLLTVEGTMKDLDPEVNVFNIVAKQQTTLSDVDWNKEFEKLAKNLYGALSHSLSIPAEADNVLKLLRKGQMKVNLRLLDLEGIMPDVNRMVDRVIICILIAALLMGSSIVCTTKLKPMVLDIPLLGLVGFLISFVMSIWLFIKMLVRRKGDRIF